MSAPSDPRYFGPARLVLEDGRSFEGMAFGARGTVVGELVFNTAMGGYQEILSDPSYCGQMVCFTVAELGNTGVNPEDMESESAGAVGMICRSLSPVVSNWRADASLGEWLAERGVPGIAELDTRAVTRHLREKGAMRAALSTESTDVEALAALAREAPSMDGRGLVGEVSTKERYTWTEGSWDAKPPEVRARVLAWDFGIKRNILRMLRDRGIETTVVPADTPAKEALEGDWDGVFLSNGPGDPAACPEQIAIVRELLEAGKRGDAPPTFGICLGHQLMCLALEGQTYKLRFGHHGGNHPVRDESNGRVAITSQNHGFAVRAESLSEDVRVSHLNLFDQTVAGFELKGGSAFGVQYHPEAAPGPNDAQVLFTRFASMVAEAGA